MKGGVYRMLTFQFVIVKRIGPCLFRHRNQIAFGGIPASSQMGKFTEPEAFFPMLKEF